jgi:hypothetical protein
MPGQSSEVGVVVLVVAETAGVVGIPPADDRALDMAEVPVGAHPVEVVLVITRVDVMTLVVIRIARAVVARLVSTVMDTRLVSPRTGRPDSGSNQPDRNHGGPP